MKKIKSRPRPLLDLKALTAFTVFIARTDKTPNSIDRHSGWRTCQLLRWLESFMLTDQKDPAALVELGHRILFSVRDKGDLSLPEVAVLAQQMMLSGYRLMLPAIKKSVIARLEAEIGAAIAALPKTPRMRRCKEYFR